MNLENVEVKKNKKTNAILCLNILVRHTHTLDILFLSNHNIHKSLYGLCFWASDPLIDRFNKNLSIKGSEAQKQCPDQL